LVWFLYFIRTSLAVGGQAPTVSNQETE